MDATAESGDRGKVQKIQLRFSVSRWQISSDLTFKKEAWKQCNVINQSSTAHLGFGELLLQTLINGDFLQLGGTV